MKVMRASHVAAACERIPDDHASARRRPELARPRRIERLTDRCVAVGAVVIPVAPETDVGPSPRSSGTRPTKPSCARSGAEPPTLRPRSSAVRHVFLALGRKLLGFDPHGAHRPVPLVEAPAAALSAARAARGMTRTTCVCAAKAKAGSSVDGNGAVHRPGIVKAGSGEAEAAGGKTQGERLSRDRSGHGRAPGNRRDARAVGRRRAERRHRRARRRSRAPPGSTSAS